MQQCIVTIKRRSSTSESLKSIVEGRMATYQTQDAYLVLDAELRPSSIYSFSFFVSILRNDFRALLFSGIFLLNLICY